VVVVVLAFPLRQKLLGAAGVHGGVVEGGGVAPGRFLVRRHGLGRVDPRKGVAKGHIGVFVLGAAGRDDLHGAAGALQAVVGPLEARVEEALGAGGVDAGLSRHAGFHLQVLEDGLLADVGQGAGRAESRWRGAGTGLLTGLEVSHRIETLTEQTDTSDDTCWSQSDGLEDNNDIYWEHSDATGRH